MVKKAKESKKSFKKNETLPAPKAPVMKLQASNPFESIWSRRKFDIVGRKRKGEERRIGLARSRAIEKRQNTLLKEYKQSTKSSVFVDKRIGEHNDALGEFDKAILRSQRERQLKLNKKSKYNLSDGEEDDFGVEGLGAMPERDDYEEEMLHEDDNDDYGGVESGSNKKMSSIQKNKVLEGGFNEGDEKKYKSKGEVYEEVIQKSKFFKAQKAKDKEENEHLMEELDANFTSLLKSKMFDVSHSVTESRQPATQVESDVFDKAVEELRFEVRGRPSDRTKTPEEIAQEEREQLEKMEEARQKRMRPSNDSDEEENEDTEELSSERPRGISGDALDDFDMPAEEPKPKRGWVDEVLERRDAEIGESEEDDSSEDSESVKDGSDDEDSDEDDTFKKLDVMDFEQSDDNNIEVGFSEKEEDEEHDANNGTDEKDLKTKDSKKAMDTSKRIVESIDAKEINVDYKQPSSRLDLPCLIKAPIKFEDLCALLDNRSNEDIILIIHRIRASNAIKLAAENRKKMQVVYGLLVQYFAVMANKRPLNYELLDLLVKPLIEMSMEMPFYAATCARERISRTRKQFCELIKKPESSCWPSSKTLFLFRLWTQIFSCSDFRHVVITPAVILMCEYLMRCHVVSARDVAVGSFLCSILLSVAKQSKKFFPEALVFIRTSLMAAKDRKPMMNKDNEYYRLLELKAQQPLLYLHEPEDKVDPLNFPVIMDLPETSSFFHCDNYRASVLLTLTETLRGYVDVYEGLSSFPELFLPISTLLLEVEQQENVPDVLQNKFREVAQLINTKVEEHHLMRRPLQMRKQKPVPIKMLNPKFEENFIKGRDYDPDREKAEKRKLKKLLKEEAKGAIRELRKDNYFLSEVKAKDKAMVEEERAEKYRKAKAFLEEQEHAFRSGQLGKGRKRRK